MLRFSPILILVCLLAACEEAPEVVPYEPATDMAGLMEHVLEPAADVLWDSAGSIITAEGEQFLAPTTEEGWLNVLNQATVVAETGNTLMLPGYRQDEGAWMEFSKGLIAAGRVAMDAAHKQDDDALFQAGARLYSVCVRHNSAACNAPCQVVVCRLQYGLWRPPHLQFFLNVLYCSLCSVKVGICGEIVSRRRGEGKRPRLC